MNDWNDLADFAEELIEDMVVEVKTKAVESFMRTVTIPSIDPSDSGITPVLSGRLMANTRVSINNPLEGSVDIYDEDGDTTYNKGVAVAKKAKAWDKIYIQNAVEGEDSNTGDMNPYWKNAEYKGWKVVGAYKFFTKSYFQMASDIEDM